MRRPDAPPGGCPPATARSRRPRSGRCRIPATGSPRSARRSRRRSTPRRSGRSRSSGPRRRAGPQYGSGSRWRRCRSLLRGGRRGSFGGRKRRRRASRTRFLPRSAVTTAVRWRPPERERRGSPLVRRPPRTGSRGEHRQRDELSHPLLHDRRALQRRAQDEAVRHRSETRETRTIGFGLLGGRSLPWLPVRNPNPDKAP